MIAALDDLLTLPNENASGAGKQPKAHKEKQVSASTTIGQSGARGNAPAQHAFGFTIFPSVSATAAPQWREIPWRTLADSLKAPTTRESKAACKLIKLARFGDAPNANGSLRHNGNVQALFGVEADYDAGEMPPAEAAARLRAAGVEALIYTSPSHTEDKPRWRVLAPLSKAHAANEHARLVSLLNGALGGGLSPESWTLSQTYYFGRVAGRSYECHHVEGQFVDLLEDAIAPIGKRKATGSLQAPETKAAATDRDVNGELEAAIYAAGRAQAIAAVTASTLVDLRAALTHIDPDGERHTWVRMGQALKCLGERGRELWIEWSARGPKFNDGKEDPGEKWESFSGEKTDHRAVFAEAKRCGWPGARHPGAADDYASRVDRTDVGNANLLARLTDSDLRFVPERDAWLRWDGSQWQVDEHRGIAQTEALRVAAHYDAQASELENQATDASLADEDRTRLAKTAKSVRQWEQRCRSKSTLDAMLAVASRMSSIQLSATALDRDPYLLGTKNGVVDLRTGQLRPVGRDNFVTKRCSAAFVPGTPAPRFQRFIAEITATPQPPIRRADGAIDPATVGRYTPRPLLASYVQRFLGYCMTGETREHKMVVAVGPGANGKSLLFDTVQWVAGAHWVSLKPEALMAGRYDADPERPTPIARSLMGARAAISSESRDGQKLDIALIKRHTGDARMTARGLHEKAVEFDITHKLVLLTNHKPVLDHLDPAIRGRLHLVPFDMRWNRAGVPDPDPALPNGDPGLMAALKGEAEGILAWLIEGAVRYHAEGLNPPPEVVAMTRTYFQEQDALGRWVAEHELCEARDGALAQELFERFKLWCEAEGESVRIATQKAFSEALQSKQVRSEKTNRGRFYGLRGGPVVTGAGL